MKLLNYTNFLNEAKIDSTFETDDKKHLLFFSDTIRKDYENSGGKYPLFYEYYENPNVFYGLDLVNNEEVRVMSRNFRSCRFTLLNAANYKDTDTDGRRNLSYERVSDILEHPNSYYFYHFVSGPRNNDAAPDRTHISEVIRQDYRKWYFILIKGKDCALVKTKSRQESGLWAEHQLSSVHGWGESSHKIQTKIMKNDVLIRANSMMRNIFDSDDADIFTVGEDPESMVKYDLIIDDGVGETRRLEVKKYKNEDIWRGGEPVELLLAEQFRMSTRAQLINIVKWYGATFTTSRGGISREIERLLSIDEREMQREFSIKIKENGKLVDNPYGTEICDIIRDYYNSKIELIENIFSGVTESKWMHGIHGIYFAGERSDRKKDFLIKIIDDDIRNITCVWRNETAWLGFNELKLYMTINGDAWEYILTEGNNFVKAFQVKDHEMFYEDINSGEIDTPTSPYVYDASRNFWRRSE